MRRRAGLEFRVLRHDSIRSQVTERVLITSERIGLGASVVNCTDEKGNTRSNQLVRGNYAGSKSNPLSASPQAAVGDEQHAMMTSDSLGSLPSLKMRRSQQLQQSRTSVGDISESRLSKRRTVARSVERCCSEWMRRDEEVECTDIGSRDQHAALCS